MSLDLLFQDRLFGDTAGKSRFQSVRCVQMAALYHVKTVNIVFGRLSGNGLVAIVLTQYRFGATDLTVTVRTAQRMRAVPQFNVVHNSYVRIHQYSVGCRQLFVQL